MVSSLHSSDQLCFVIEVLCFLYNRKLIIYIKFSLQRMQAALFKLVLRIVFSWGWVMCLVWAEFCVKLGLGFVFSLGSVLC
jgi:hypothetical protein